MKESQAKEQISFIKELMTSPGWKLLCKDIEDNIKFIEWDLLSFNPEGNSTELIYTKTDEKKIRRQILQWLLEMPADMIHQLDGNIEEWEDVGYKDEDTV